MPPPRDDPALPDYANRAGDPAFPPPYKVDEAGLDIFICPADGAALQSIVDKALNQPTETFFKHCLPADAAALRMPDDSQPFVVDEPFVGLACIDVRRFESSACRPPGQLGRTKIFARQREVAFMVPIVQGEQRYWYLPYVLNDLPTAIVTGREIYGYPKQFAKFIPALKSKKDEDPDYTIFGPDRASWWDAMHVQAYDLECRPGGDYEFCLTDVLVIKQGRAPVMAATALAHAAAIPELQPGDLDIVPAPEDAVEAPAPPLRATAPLTPGLDAAKYFLDRIHSDTPYVFLRQFRDPRGEAKASYQAIVVGQLLPDPADSLLPPESDSSKKQPPYHVHLPWAFNLDLSGQLFGKHLDEGDSHDVEVCGLLSGGNATFKVVQANLLWQSVGPIRPPAAATVLAPSSGQ